MKVYMTGATGFVGTALLSQLVAVGHEVVVLTRPGETVTHLPEASKVVVGDPMRPGPWWDEVAECDAAINLAGAPIFTRWNGATKELIRDSRVLTTQNLVRAIPEQKPFVLASTSAVGIYGDAGDRRLDEQSPLGNDFLARVARQWETEARKAEDKNCRVLLLRFGIVLDADGGAFSQLKSVSNRFIGGPVGGGRQWFSWIHRQDLIRAIRFLLDNPDAEGVFNLNSPNPVRQIDVSRTLGHLLGRPSFVPAPAFAVRLVLGEFADVVLNSQKMIPQRLLDEGFVFDFPLLGDALRAILDNGQNTD